MGTALRWLVAVLSTIAVFFVVWGVLAMGTVDADLTLSLAGLMSSVQGGFLFWWAGRERRQPSGLDPVPTPILVGEIPQQPAAFQPRLELYRQLTEARTPTDPSPRPGGPSIHVLAGARGVGKTQLAAAYARRCIAERWPVVAWINADEPDQVLSALALLAEELGLRRPGDHAEEAAGKVRRWLETTAPDRCLVVFDNAVDPGELRRRLPVGGRARIVITSNDRAFENLGTLIDVGVFSEAEALALLAERTGLDDEAGARLLAAEVGHLPIALAQSAAVIRRQALTYQTFVRRLLELPIDGYLAPLPGDPYPHGAAHAALLSLESARRDNPLSQPLTELLSVLAPARVGRGLLYAAARDGLLADGASVAPHQVDEALAVLRESACLITFSVDGQAVIMHRFTQRVVRDCARHRGTLPSIVHMATGLLTSALIPEERIWARRIEGGHLVQQITALCDAAGICELRRESIRCRLHERDNRADTIESLLALRRWTVLYHHAVSNLTGAIDLGAITLAEHEDLLGADHPDTLEVADLLGTARQDAGDFDAAVLLFERSLAARRAALPEGDPQIVASRHRLACANQEAGRLDEAIALYERVIADRERMLGVDHPQTLSSRNKLACALRDAHRFEESIALYEQTLADRCRVLAPDDPAIATSRGRLARVYALVGRTDEAIALYEQAVDHRARVLGPDHPHTLQFRNDLADAYRSAGRSAEAIQLYERTLADSSRLLGDDHPLTQTIHHNLATARGALLQS